MLSRASFRGSFTGSQTLQSATLPGVHNLPESPIMLQVPKNAQDAAREEAAKKAAAIAAGGGGGGGNNNGNVNINMLSSDFGTPMASVSIANTPHAGGLAPLIRTNSNVSARGASSSAPSSPTNNNSNNVTATADQIFTITPDTCANQSVLNIVQIPTSSTAATSGSGTPIAGGGLGGYSFANHSAVTSSYSPSLLGLGGFQNHNTAAGGGGLSPDMGAFNAAASAGMYPNSRFGMKHILCTQMLQQHDKYYFCWALDGSSLRGIKVGLEDLVDTLDPSSHSTRLCSDSEIAALLRTYCEQQRLRSRCCVFILWDVTIETLTYFINTYCPSWGAHVLITTAVGTPLQGTQGFVAAAQRLISNVKLLSIPAFLRDEPDPVSGSILTTVEKYRRVCEFHWIPLLLTRYNQRNLVLGGGSDFDHGWVLKAVKSVHYSPFYVRMFMFALAQLKLEPFDAYKRFEALLEKVVSPMAQQQEKLRKDFIKKRSQQRHQSIGWEGDEEEEEASESTDAFLYEHHRRYTTAATPAGQRSGAQAIIRFFESAIHPSDAQWLKVLTLLPAQVPQSIVHSLGGRAVFTEVGVVRPAGASSTTTTTSGGLGGFGAAATANTANNAANSPLLVQSSTFWITRSFQRELFNDMSEEEKTAAAHLLAERCGRLNMEFSATLSDRHAAVLKLHDQHTAREIANEAEGGVTISDEVIEEAKAILATAQGKDPQQQQHNASNTNNDNESGGASNASVALSDGAAGAMVLSGEGVLQLGRPRSQNNSAHRGGGGVSPSDGALVTMYSPHLNLNQNGAMGGAAQIQSATASAGGGVHTTYTTPFAFGGADIQCESRRTSVGSTVTGEGAGGNTIATAGHPTAGIGFNFEISRRNSGATTGSVAVTPLMVNFGGGGGSAMNARSPKFGGGGDTNNYANSDVHNGNAAAAAGGGAPFIITNPRDATTWARWKEHIVKCVVEWSWSHRIVIPTRLEGALLDPPSVRTFNDIVSLPGLPEDEERYFTPELAALYRHYALVFLQREDPLTAAAALERSLCIYTFAFAKASSEIDKRYGNNNAGNQNGGGGSSGGALGRGLSGMSGAASPTDVSLGAGGGGNGPLSSNTRKVSGGGLNSIASMRMMASFRKPHTTAVESGTQSFLYSMLMLLIEKTYRDVAHCYSIAKMEGLAEPFVDRSGSLLLVANGGRRDTPCRAMGLFEQAHMKIKLSEMERRRRDVVQTNSDEIDDHNIKNDRALREMVSAEVNETQYALAARNAAEEALRALSLTDAKLTGALKAALHQWVSIGHIYVQDDGKALQEAILARDEIVQCTRVAQPAAANNNSTASGGGGGTSGGSVADALLATITSAPRSKPPSLVERMQEVKWVKSQLPLFYGAIHRRDYSKVNELLDKSTLFAFFGFCAANPMVTILCEANVTIDGEPLTPSNNKVKGPSTSFGKKKSKKPANHRRIVDEDGLLVDDDDSAGGNSEASGEEGGDDSDDDEAMIPATVSSPTITSEVCKIEMPPPNPHTNLSLRTGFTEIELASHYGGDWRKQPVKYCLPIHELLLSMKTTSSNTPTAEEKKGLQLLARLLATGTSMKTASPHDLRTPLHIAVGRNMIVATMILLREGHADPSFVPPIRLQSLRSGLSTYAKISEVSSAQPSPCHASLVASLAAAPVDPMNTADTTAAIAAVGAAIFPPVEHCTRNDTLLMLLATSCDHPQQVFARHLKSIVERLASSDQRREFLVQLFGKDTTELLRNLGGVGGANHPDDDDDDDVLDYDVEYDEDGNEVSAAVGKTRGLFRQLLLPLIGGQRSATDQRRILSNGAGNGEEDESTTDTTPIPSFTSPSAAAAHAQQKKNKINAGRSSIRNFLSTIQLPLLSSEAREELASICPPHRIGEALMASYDDPFVVMRLCYKLIAMEDADGSMNPYKILGIFGKAARYDGEGRGGNNTRGGFDAKKGLRTPPPATESSVATAAAGSNPFSGMGSEMTSRSQSPLIGEAGEEDDSAAGVGSRDWRRKSGAPQQSGGLASASSLSPMKHIKITTDYTALAAHQQQQQQQQHGRYGDGDNGGADHLYGGDGSMRASMMMGGTANGTTASLGNISASFDYSMNGGGGSGGSQQHLRRFIVNDILLQLFCLCIRRDAMHTVVELLARFPHRVSTDALHWEDSTLYRRRMRAYLDSQDPKAKLQEQFVALTTAYEQNNNNNSNGGEMTAF